MSIPQLDNTPRCQHVRLSGRPCHAPARRGTPYCLFHAAEHTAEANLAFPPVEDAATVQVAVDQVLQALKGDSIDFRRAALLFAGLRIARANLKLLGLELGEVIEDRLGAAGPTKKEDDLPGPSLAEILLERLSAIQTEDAREQGRPAPAPMSPDIIAQAKAEGRLPELLMERLELVEPPDNNSAPSTSLRAGSPGVAPVEGDRPTT